jgi:glyoxylase-like metal-dependent hydrolase (beta-lactamase superfamily II)
VEHTGARVIAHEAEWTELRRHYTGPLVEMRESSAWLLGDVSLQLLHTPGHTFGSLSILASGQLFSGDTLSVGAVGRPEAAAGAIGALWQTVDGPLRALPGSTVIRPGHDSGPQPASTMEDERRSVPALTTDCFESFVFEMEAATGRTHRFD